MGPAKMSRPEQSPKKKMHPLQRLEQICNVFRNSELENVECEEDYSQYQIYLPARVEHMTVTAMMDSGNLWRSALSWDLAQKLGLTPKDIRPIPGYSKIGTAARGGQLEVMGETRKKLRINLGGGTKDILCKPVIIRNLSMSCNLSGPFLKKNKIDLLHTGDAMIQGRKVPMHTKTGTFEKMASTYSVIYTTENVTVEPWEMCRIPTVASAVQKGDIVTKSLLVMGDGAFTEKYDLHPMTNAYVKCQSDGSMDVFTLNTTSHKVRVKKGSIYGIGFQTTSPDKMIKEPWKVAMLEPVVNPDADQSSTGKLPKMEPQKTADKIAVEEDKRWKEEHDIPTDFDMSLDAYVVGNDQLPKFMRGATNHSNMKKRVAFLLRFFKLDQNDFLKGKNEMRATLAVLLRYWDIWAFSGNYGVTDLIEHKITLEPGTRPIHERYRPPNPLLEESMKKQLNLWLKLDLKHIKPKIIIKFCRLKHKVIEKSNSPWNFSLVAAISKPFPKFRMKIWGHPYLFSKIKLKIVILSIEKGGKVRWCTDWRSLNRVTIKVSWKMTIEVQNNQDNIISNGVSIHRIGTL